MDFLDIVGTRFGKLTVTEHLGLRRNGKRNRRFYACHCDCGNDVAVARGCLRNGATRSCGCYRHDRKWSIHSGQVYGRLTVLNQTRMPHGNSTCVAFQCQCACGNLTTIRGADLGRTTNSCGCLHLEKAVKHISAQHDKNKLAYGESAFNRVRRAYARRAKMRGQDCTLTPDQFREKITKACHYCGSMPSSVSNENNGAFVYSGLDRLRNDKGYTLENTVPCCRQCNLAKNALDLSDFEAWIVRVHERLKRARAGSSA